MDPRVAWQATPAWWRALAVAATGLVLALLLQRPDLIALTSPFALAAALDFRRPQSRPPRATTDVTPSLLREGESVLITHHHPHPADGLLTISVDQPQGDVDAPRATVSTSSTTTRKTTPSWGVHTASPRVTYCATTWSGWSLRVPSPEPSRYLVLPSRSGPRRIPEPRPAGLGPGPDPGMRAGDGLDYQGLRNLHPSESPRRVNWPATLRTGRMIGTQTFADTTAAYLLILDARADGQLGDLARQLCQFAAGVIRRGGAVALAVHGCGDVAPIPLGSGERHLTQLEITLAKLIPREASTNDYQHGRTRRLRLLPGTVVLALSPLDDPALTPLLIHLKREHMRVSVLDTSHIATEPLQACEQTVRRRALEARGIPVTPYDGPASLAITLTRTARTRR